MARLARVEILAADEIAQRLRRVFGVQFSVNRNRPLLVPVSLGRMW